MIVGLTGHGRCSTGIRTFHIRNRTVRNFSVTRSGFQDFDDESLPKVEAQVWIGIYNLFAKKACSEKYELHSYRRNMVIKLQQYLNEDLVS